MASQRVRADYPSSVEISGAIEPGYERVLTGGALEFVAALVRRFEPERRRLMEHRAARQAGWDAGALPDFLPETQANREGGWKVAAIPDDLLDRRVEITGPAAQKMIVNALNSGASVFMAGFEDALSPTWSNIIEGQINLMDYWLGEIDFTEEDTGRHYAVVPKPAILMVRPRGWHLLEDHIGIDGEKAAGARYRPIG
jgi:malate synthase